MTYSDVNESYLVQGVGFIVVNDTYFACVSKIYNVTVFDVDDVLNREGDFDAVAVIVRSKYDLL